MKDSRILPSLSKALRSGASMMLVVLCAAVLTFGAVFYLWQRYQFVRLGYEVETPRAQRARLEAGIEPLQVEADFLSRPGRIGRLARERLGMQRPVPSQVIVLEGDVPLAAKP